MPVKEIEDLWAYARVMASYPSLRARHLPAPRLTRQAALMLALMASALWLLGYFGTRLVILLL